MAKPSKLGESDFVLRTMDILLDAEHRKLETIDPKKIKEIVEDLATIKDEAAAAEVLKDTQRQEYNNLMAEIKNNIGVLESFRADIPDEIRLDIENIERKKREDERKALEEEEEVVLEPE